MKEVLKSFVDVHSTLRLVVAMTAFSKGYDCPNVRNVIHFECLEQLNSTFKKSTELAKMVSRQQLFYCYGSPGKHVKPNMERIRGIVADSCYTKTFCFTIILIMHNLIVVIYVIHN